MVLFHLNILLSIPMGVPLEWNMMFIYSGLVLFGAYGDVHVWDIESPVLIALLVGLVLAGRSSGASARTRSRSCRRCGTTPATGRPACGCSGRGPWSGSTSTSPRPAAAIAASSRADRGGHLRRDHARGRRSGPCTSTAGHGQRACSPGLRRGRDRTEGPDACRDEGEMHRRVVLGWNFGDGHLHHEQLLAAVQAECGFAPGDLRCCSWSPSRPGSPGCTGGSSTPRMAC